MTHFDKWLYVLKHLREFENKPPKLQEKVFEKLFNQAEVAKLNPEEMRTYDESLKIYRDNYSVIETAKHEGRQQGREEGKEEGREEGRQEERFELARRFKQRGVDIQIIAETTGLTREQIEKL